MNRGTSILNKLGSKSKQGGNGRQKTWIHAPVALTQNFAVYQAKLLGVLKVQEAKGVDVVKDAIKKLKLAHEINKSEAGNKGSKLPKVEIWISVDLVKIVHTKTKVVLHQRQLHKISYCADDHFETKLFSMIAKNDTTGGHECFVFITEKEASDLTLTVGQSFELAYQRYLQKRGAADLMRSREEAMQRDTGSQNGVTVSGYNGAQPTETPRVITEEAPPKQDFLVDFSSSGGQSQVSLSGDPFEQYLASVASRGVSTSDQFHTDSGAVPNSTPATQTSSAMTNPFQVADVSTETVPSNSSPHLPRPKGSGSHVPSSSFPHALPKPPSKKDIKKNSPMARPRPIPGAQMHAVNEKPPEPASTNPFRADPAPSVDLISSLESDFSQNLNVKPAETFDPFG